MKTFFKGSVLAVLVLVSAACASAPEPPAPYEEWIVAGEVYEFDSHTRESCPSYQDPTISRTTNFGACRMPPGGQLY